MALPWQGPLPSSDHLTQLYLLASPTLLTALLSATLPHTGPPDLPPAHQQEQARGRAPAAMTLCQLLGRVLDLPATQQRVLISLSSGGQLVERLWFSLLAPMQGIEPSPWGELEVVDPTHAGDPGWMRVLLLLSQVFNCFILTAGVCGFCWDVCGFCWGVCGFCWHVCGFCWCSACVCGLQCVS